MQVMPTTIFLLIAGSIAGLIKVNLVAFRFKDINRYYNICQQ